MLSIQDTTLLDWTHHPSTEGLGKLANSNQRGLVAHSTMLFTPQRVPLGLIAQQVWARSDESVKNNRPIEEKESYKWIESLNATITAHAELPNTQFISIGDREADVYDLFLVERPVGVELLVRAAQNRCVEDDQRYLWEALSQPLFKMPFNWISLVLNRLLREKPSLRYVIEKLPYILRPNELLKNFQKSQYGPFW